MTVDDKCCGLLEGDWVLLLTTPTCSLGDVIFFLCYCKHLLVDEIHGMVSTFLSTWKEIRNDENSETVTVLTVDGELESTSRKNLREVKEAVKNIFKSLDITGRNIQSSFQLTHRFRT